MRGVAFIFAALAMLCFPAMTNAADPGDPCSSKGSYEQRAPPDGETWMYCDGSTWVLLQRMDSDAAATYELRIGSKKGVQISNDTVCASAADAGTLRYNPDFDPGGGGGSCTGGDCDGKIRVFVTSSVWRGGNLGGITGADAKCQALADGKGWTGTYRAWLADSNAASAPATRFEIAGTSLPMEQPGGNPGPGNWADLISGDNAGIRYDENAGDQNLQAVWTNVDSDGTQKGTSNECNDWAVNSGSGINGTANHPTGSKWTVPTTGNGTSCFLNNSLYCFEMEVPDAGGGGSAASPFQYCDGNQWKPIDNP